MPVPSRRCGVWVRVRGSCMSQPHSLPQGLTSAMEQRRQQEQDGHMTNEHIAPQRRVVELRMHSCKAWQLLHQALSGVSHALCARLWRHLKGTLKVMTWRGQCLGYLVWGATCRLVNPWQANAHSVARPQPQTATLCECAWSCPAAPCPCGRWAVKALPGQGCLVQTPAGHAVLDARLNLRLPSPASWDLIWRRQPCLAQQLPQLESWSLQLWAEAAAPLPQLWSASAAVWSCQQAFQGRHSVFGDPECICPAVVAMAHLLQPQLVH